MLLFYGKWSEGLWVKKIMAMMCFKQLNGFLKCGAVAWLFHKLPGYIA